MVLVDTVFQAIWDPAWEGGRYTGERQQGGLKLLPLQSQEAGPQPPFPSPWVTPHEHHRACPPEKSAPNLETSALHMCPQLTGR